MRVGSPEDLGAAAREQRRALGLSQADVARRSGVTRQWIVRFERGAPDMSLSKAFAVLRTIDLALRTDDATTSIRVPRIDLPKIDLAGIDWARVTRRLAQGAAAVGKVDMSEGSP